MQGSLLALTCISLIFILFYLFIGFQSKKKERKRQKALNEQGRCVLRVSAFLDISGVF